MLIDQGASISNKQPIMHLWAGFKEVDRHISNLGYRDQMVYRVLIDDAWWSTY